MKVINYKNREGSIFTFTPMSNGNIKWEGDFDYHRFGFPTDSSKIDMVDPSGGPYLSSGEDCASIHNQWSGKFIKEFIKIDTGYEIVIR